MAIGQRDMENGTYEVARRDTLEKRIIPATEIIEEISSLLVEIQDNIFEKAKAYRESHITEVNSYEEFKTLLEEKGGFLSAHWDGTSETEERVKEETKATIRCIPLSSELEEGRCMVTGKPSSRRVLFAKAY